MNILITGITGQDGSFLAEYCLKHGHNVFGIIRRTSILNFSRIQHILPNITLIEADMLDQTSLINALKKSKPDRIFNLAAQSFVPLSWSEPTLTTEITGIGVLRLLDAIHQVCPDARFYQASSSEMFGKVCEIPQTEKTPFYPRSPYGIAKCFGHWITVNYRESYNIFACSGILYNHESYRRGLEFVTRKITNGVARIKSNTLDYIELGNLNSMRDWGHAKDYMRAAYMMLDHNEPDDYVVATGATYTIKYFCTRAFCFAGIPLEWEGEGLEEVGRVNGKVRVKINKDFYRPAEVDVLLGDSTKAKVKLGWEPSISLDDLIHEMVQYDLSIEQNKE
jgi:GDPmannose 4,6-dehydratase